MLKASCTRWLYGLLMVIGFVNGLIEMVEEQQCHDQEFRLTCRELDTHIAVLEAWYTTTETLLQNTTTNRTDIDDQRQLQIDTALNQVYVYTSPNHNGYYESSNRSYETSTVYDNNDTLNVNETEISVDIFDTDACGVRGYLRSYSSWKEGGRARWHAHDVSINLRAPLSYRCTGVNHCSFILSQDYPPSVSWSPGVVYIKYACFDDSLSVHYCNREVLIAETGPDSEGYVRTPGYPNYYIGDVCRWRLRVHHEQLLRITLLDVSLRSIGPFENECKDYVTVVDSTGDVLMSSCDQVAVPLRIVSKSSSVEVIVNASSAGAFPKRGVLLHYKSINCVTLPAPSNGYLVYRNENYAHYLCNVKHVFADTRQRARVTWCFDDNRWNDTVPLCVDEATRAVANGSAVDSTESDVKLPPNDANMIVDIVIPSLLIAALFIGNAFIVLIIYKYRKRKTDDTEDEFNTIPLSVNGNVHSAGNAV